jgi:hypothetical protein
MAGELPLTTDPRDWLAEIAQWGDFRTTSDPFANAGMARLILDTIDNANQRLKEIMQMETKTQGHGTIGWAVSALQHGHTLRRAGWNGKGMYLLYAPPGAIQLAQKFGGGYNTTAAIFMKTVDDELVPWLCSQSDILAGDWEMVDAVQPGEHHAAAA